MKLWSHVWRTCMLAIQEYFAMKTFFFMALHYLQILDKDHQWQQVAEAFKQRENISKEADKSVKEAR